MSCSVVSPPPTHFPDKRLSPVNPRVLLSSAAFVFNLPGDETHANFADGFSCGVGDAHIRYGAPRRRC